MPGVLTVIVHSALGWDDILGLLGVMLAWGVAIGLVIDRCRRRRAKS
jgi:hypothetical protein